MNNNQYLTKIVAASLLGDGCVHIPNDGSRNAQYSQTKTIDHVDYVDWMCERLEQITRTRRYEYQPKMENAKRSIVFHTMRHPFYTKFKERMYGTGKKCVDPHYLTLLDWEFLAIWFQEDGNLHARMRDRDKRPDVQIMLATNCFSYGDQLLLKNALKEKLDLEWNIRPYINKKGDRLYTIHLLRKCSDRFLEGISKFILPSFQYKCSYDRLLEIG